MPPRRSCFLGDANIGNPDPGRFNATTAFLLLLCWYWRLRHSGVSMPPRRSCFTSRDLGYR